MKVYPIRNKEKLNKIELILKTTNKRNYLLFVLGTNTGLRISDILKLKVKVKFGTSREDERFEVYDVNEISFKERK